MVPIKHILYEYGVDQIFKLSIPGGESHIIKQPEGWDEVESIVNINEETFNVEDFIVGSNTKLKFSEYTDKVAYDLIRSVYNSSGGDGRLIFKWIAVKDDVEYDLLGDRFELNFNKKNESFDKNYMKIEMELVKNEAVNKMYTREDTTIDLFADKDLDDNNITPVSTFNIGYKKGDQILSNFYTFDISQYKFGVNGGVKSFFYSFVRSDDYSFGTNTNNYASWKNSDTMTGGRKYQGPFVETNITLSNLKVEISNMNISVQKAIAGDNFADATLFAVIRGNNQEIRKPITSTVSVPLPGGGTYGEIKIDNGIFDLGNLMPGQNLTFEIISNADENLKARPLGDNTSIEITTNIESPLVKTKGVRLIEALNQIAKNYTSGVITSESFVLGMGGAFYNTSISTGMYLRGLPDIYLSQKMKTSLKAILNEGSAKLLALGYDITEDKLIVENIGYFFKDLRIYDLSEKQYLMEGFSIENDTSVSYNNLVFGSKKYSTDVKFDIKNFNTVAELSTPIKTNKNKLDKQTDLIIDSFKIQELIEDKSSSTNDNDDDKVLIDMVQVNDIWDQGVFQNCSHSQEGGSLLLSCTSPSFDTTLIEVGSSIQIVEGKNVGSWTVLSIEGAKMKVNKTSGIESGIVDTPIRYKIDALIKNRTNEGFIVDGETVFRPQTSTNIRHNPKYQMARWWPLFGSGLRKKIDSDTLKVTNYKNNSEAKVKIVGSDMTNELPGDVIVGSNEDLLRFRDFEQTFFNGEQIEITYSKVAFEEFYLIYNNWRYGEGNDRTKSRGYISCNTPFGIYDVYPFGPEAFKHNKATNTLTIKGKVKGKSVDNPVLLSVVQVDRNTVTLTWDYVVEYISPVIKIQYSLEGSNWETVHTVTNVKTATFSTSVFNSIITGTDVYFRIIAITADYYNKVSNTRLVTWAFNDWILREISRTENIGCGYSYLTLELLGTVNLEIKFTYSDLPGGGEYSAIDSDANTLAYFNSTYGPGNTNIQTETYSITSESKLIYIQLKNSDKTESGQPLNCNSGTVIYNVRSSLNIDFKDLSTGDITSLSLLSRIFKKYFDYSPDIDPEIP